MTLQYRVAKKRKPYRRLARLLGTTLVKDKRASHTSLADECGFEGFEDDVEWPHVVGLLLNWINEEDIALIPDPISFNDTLKKLKGHVQLTPLCFHAFKKHNADDEHQNPEKYIAGGGAGRTTEGYALHCPENAHFVDAHIGIRKAQTSGRIKKMRETYENGSDAGQITSLTPLPPGWNGQIQKLIEEDVA